MKRVKKYNNKIFYSVFKDDKIFDELVSWLLSIQKDDGSFPGSYGDFKNQRSIVFNNGQILLGLVDYYLDQKMKYYLKKLLNMDGLLVFKNRMVHGKKIPMFNIVQTQELHGLCFN